jgi:triphosphoribosyl-dephospho-CoA synthetase
MISDPDIWRAAQLIVKRHGAGAPIVAAQRADELFEEGDLDGAAIWKRILHAVQELQRVKPKVGERVN